MYQLAKGCRVNIVCLGEISPPLHRKAAQSGLKLVYPPAPPISEEGKDPTNALHLSLRCVR
jgi:hypothetical protein